MSDKYPSLSIELSEFIARQHLFFVATAARDGRVNLSPKGHESLRVLGPNEILWLNLTGSGNETAAHLLDSNRMTLMWCAFEGPPRILRVYGEAKTIHPNHAEWDSCVEYIPAPVSGRQYFKLKIDLVQTSCGFTVPFMDYQQDRDILEKWSEKRGEDGVRKYWQEKNTTSIDGFPTGILD
ncbi:MAG: pyridoxamine 5'-phosphate oxidase [Planctomycetota bacterium]|nr:MAG: pyridoxamine 5'-phosphate oxidase [Planctomycetota bacterium]